MSPMTIYPHIISIGYPDHADIQPGFRFIAWYHLNAMRGPVMVNWVKQLQAGQGVGKVSGMFFLDDFFGWIYNLFFMDDWMNKWVISLWKETWWCSPIGWSHQVHLGFARHWNDPPGICWFVVSFGQTKIETILSSFGPCLAQFRVLICQWTFIKLHGIFRTFRKSGLWSSLLIKETMLGRLHINIINLKRWLTYYIFWVSWAGGLWFCSISACWWWCLRGFCMVCQRRLNKMNAWRMAVPRHGGSFCARPMDSSTSVQTNMPRVFRRWVWTCQGLNGSWVQPCNSIVSQRHSWGWW